jgi:hypothetical protein
MDRKPSLRLSIAASCAVIVGLLTTPAAITSADDASVFTGPGFPSPQCTSLIDGNPFGIVPQQWNSSVGLPLTPSGTPAAQRIVIPEFDQLPNMAAVNALLRQCGLLVPSDPDYTLNQSSLPTTDGWASPATAAGVEATLDATIAYAALPANTAITIANTAGADSWYGFFVNAAQACGIEFASAPTPSDTAATVPSMSKGSNFPAGGCIISASYGSNEQSYFEPLLLDNTQAANAVIERLATLGVLVFVAAGDEGAGGCWVGANGQVISGVALSTPDSVRTIDGLTFYTGEATFTTPVAHGYSVGSDIIINQLSGPPNVGVLSGIFEVVSVPSATTFTIQQALGSRIQISQSEAAGWVSTLSAPNYGVTFNQVFFADPTIKFLLQTGAKIPSFPATHPDVVAVGGTQWLPQADALEVSPFDIPYDPGRPYSNFVWKDGNPNANCSNAPQTSVLGQEGTGGGVSGQFAMPDYQRAQAEATYGNQGVDAKRMMPDIAALAGWPTYAIGNPSAGSFCPTGNDPEDFPCANADDFPWTPVVGTSAATPLSAIGFANVNAVLSARGLAPITKGGSNDIHELIYSATNSSAFHDVPEFRGATSSGDNNLFGQIFGATMGYSALNGFDMTTGMGVPNFATLANLLIDRNTPAPAPAPSPQPTAAPTTPPAAQPTTAPEPTPAPDPIVGIIADPSTVTAAALNSLTPAQVAAIPASAFGQLPPRAFRGLTPDQVRQLSPAQVSAIRPARARAIRPAVLRSFTPAQIRELRPASIRALRPNQVRLLRPLQIRALTARQLEEIRPRQRAVMTPAQIRALRR